MKFRKKKPFVIIDMNPKEFRGVNIWNHALSEETIMFHYLLSKYASQLRDKGYSKIIAI